MYPRVQVCCLLFVLELHKNEHYRMQERLRTDSIVSTSTVYLLNTALNLMCKHTTNLS